MPVSGQCAAWTAPGPLHHGLGSQGTGWGAEGGKGECPALQELDFTIHCVLVNAGGQFCQANPSGRIECVKSASGIPGPWGGRWGTRGP
ncbi:hypothetical protein FKM82_000738 [Ascaphus truei]